MTPLFLPAPVTQHRPIDTVRGLSYTVPALAAGGSRADDGPVGGDGHGHGGGGGWGGGGASGDVGAGDGGGGGGDG